jgi:CTP:molybdopterin cytidylyltransferase MocA
MRSQAAASSNRVTCIVLAAGESRRLGRPKQLLRKRLEPLLVAAVRAVTHAARNARWREGLASSLQRGLAATPPDARAVLVLLADQPDVTPRALARLVAAWRKRPRVPAAAYYDGRAGVPAILPRSTWRAIRALEGDAGARAILRAAPHVTLVPMPEAALDIDTPADAARLR